MEINYRIQEKFIEGKYALWIEFPDGSKRETDYNEIELILKDIRFIRHELSNYSYLYASQLSFGGHLNQNYWEFLKLNGEIGQDDRDELEEGVLLIIYLFYTEIFEAEGWSFLYRKKLFDIIYSFLDSYIPNNDNKKKIIDYIKFSIENYKNESLWQHYSGKLDKENNKLRNRLLENDKWVHKKFVEDYFVDLANSFEPLRKETDFFFNSIMKRMKNK